MRKFKKIALVLVLCISLLSLTGCKERKAIAVEEFQSKMTEKGFTVYDVREQFSSYSEVKGALVAKGDNYQIEYLSFADDEGAKSSFAQNKSTFESSKGTVTTTQVSVTTNNYEKYHLVSNGKYMSVTRVGNTIIYANVDSKYRTEVLDIIEDLGY